VFQAVVKGNASGIAQNHAQVLPASKMHDVEGRQPFAVEVTGKASTEAVRVALDTRGLLQPSEHGLDTILIHTPDCVCLVIAA